MKTVILANCTKSMQGHLRYINIRDTTLDSDAKLLLAQQVCKSSMYVCMPNINKFKSGHLARNFNFQYLVHIYQEPSKINKFTFKVLF